MIKSLLTLSALGLTLLAHAQTAQQVVDVPTRNGVTQRVLLLSPPEPKATFLLLSGGHGGLGIFPNGSLRWGEGNFLVRSRRLFVDQGVAVAVVDAPSDRQVPPYLAGFRQTPEHVADVKALIAWARERSKVPVWRVGTSRGTQSAAFVATELHGSEGPDGVVLSSSILKDPRGRPVPAMPLEAIRVPVLVVHHAQDGCALCPFSDIDSLTSKLTSASRTRLLQFQGGENRGDPCEAFAYHGFNGIEAEVVRQVVSWALAR